MRIVRDTDGRYVPEDGFTDPNSITTAPQGMLRIVQIDPRDGWPTRELDCVNRTEAAAALQNMWGPKAETMAVYDDSGSLVQVL